MSDFPVLSADFREKIVFGLEYYGGVAQIRANGIPCRVAGFEAVYGYGEASTDITDEVWLCGLYDLRDPEFWHCPDSPVLELTAEDMALPFALLRPRGAGRAWRVEVYVPVWECYDIREGVPGAVARLHVTAQQARMHLFA
jgi:hypothetical protein